MSSSEQTEAVEDTLPVMKPSSPIPERESPAAVPPPAVAPFPSAAAAAQATATPEESMKALNAVMADALAEVGSHAVDEDKCNGKLESLRKVRREGTFSLLRLASIPGSL